MKLNLLIGLPFFFFSPQSGNTSRPQQPFQTPGLPAECAQMTLERFQNTHSSPSSNSSLPPTDGAGLVRLRRARLSCHPCAWWRQILLHPHIIPPYRVWGKQRRRPRPPAQHSELRLSSAKAQDIGSEGRLWPSNLLLQTSLGLASRRARAPGLNFTCSRI